MQRNHKRVAIGIAIAAVIVVIGISVWDKDRDKTNSNKNKYGAEFKLVGTEKANIGYIAERLYIIYKNELEECGKLDDINYEKAFENTEGKDEINALANADILSSFGIIDNYTSDTVINKYGLSEAIYKIVELVEKDTIQFSNSYNDVGRKYEKPVGLAERADAFSIEDNNMFIGSRVLTEYEADTALNKFEQYIKTLKRKGEKEETKETEETEGQIVSTPEFKIDLTPTDEEREKAKEVLWDKKFEDNLNGRSVAVHTNPKSIEELKMNIDKLVKIDPYNVDKYNPNFINIDEGLYDYKTIHIGTDFEKEFGYKEIKMEQPEKEGDKEKFNNQENDAAVINKSIGKPDIIARSKALNGMQIQFGKTQMIKLSHPMLKTISLSKVDGTGNQFRQDCYLIRNGQVIGKGYITNMQSTFGGERIMSLNYKRDELKKAEYIGIVTEKMRIDGESSRISTLLLMDIPDIVRESIAERDEQGK